MRSVKMALVALTALLAMATATAASASAHEFRVEGKGVSKEETFTGSGGNYKILGSFDGTKVGIECQKSTSKGALLTGGSLRVSFELTECVLTGEAVPPCKLSEKEEKEMSTSDGSALLGGTGPKLEHKGAGSSEEFFTVEVESPNGCPLPPANYIMTGSWTCELREVGVEAVEHEETCTKLDPSDLYLFGSKATLVYNQKVKLVSGKKWSAV